MPDAPKVVSTMSAKIEMPMGAPTRDLCLYLPKSQDPTRLVTIDGNVLELPGNQDTIGLEGKFPATVVVDGTQCTFTKDDVIDVVYNDTVRPCITYL